MSSVAAQQSVPAAAAAAQAGDSSSSGSAAAGLLNMAQLRRGEMTPTNSGEKRKIDLQREL